MSVTGFRVDKSKYDIDASEFHRTLTDHVNQGKSITIAPSPDAYRQPHTGLFKNASWVPIDSLSKPVPPTPAPLTREACSKQMADDAVAIFDVGGAVPRDMILEDGLKDLQDAIVNLMKAAKE